MKIKYRFITDPDDNRKTFLMGMAFVKGKHRMTGLPFAKGQDEREARKIIKRAFAKFAA